MPKSPLQKIQESILKLLIPRSSSELYQACLHEAIAVAKAHSGSLFLERNGRLVRMASNVPVEKQLTPRPDGNTYKVFLDGKMKILSQKTLRVAHPEAKNISSWIIIIPLRFQAKKFGAFTLHVAKKPNYSQDYKRSLEVFGSLVTLVIRNLQLYERSQIALKNRELFLSTAAHELKTPLTLIQAYSQLASKNINKSKPVQKKWMDSILAQTSKLQSLIKDLFNVSQLNMGIFSYQFKNVSLLSLLQKIVEDSKLLHQRNIILTTKLKKTDSIIEVDPEKLSLVFINILGNSVKHSPLESNIEIQLFEEDNNLVVTIRDFGKGISAEDLPHVFEKFYRGRQSGASGLGLGMYLCKEIVQAHHGLISVESTINKGTTVRISLPLE